MEFIDTIEINASAEKVFDYLVDHMTDSERYQQWHPEHRVMEWIKGDPMAEGSVAYCEEYLEDQLQKLKFKFTRVERPRRIEYRVLFPLSLFAPGNAFDIQPLGEDRCKLVASGKINMSEKTFLKMHEYHAEKMRLTKRHMKEEGENIKQALESH